MRHLTCQLAIWLWTDLRWGTANSRGGIRSEEPFIHRWFKWNIESAGIILKKILIHDNGFIPNGYYALLWRAWMLESPTNHNSKWGSLPDVTGFPKQTDPNSSNGREDDPRLLAFINRHWDCSYRSSTPSHSSQTAFSSWKGDRMVYLDQNLYASDIQWPSWKKKASPHLRKKVCMANNMFLRS